MSTHILGGDNSPKTSVFKPLSTGVRTELQREYQSFIIEHGISSFLEKYLPEHVTAKALQLMIVDLGYSDKVEQKKGKQVGRRRYSGNPVNSAQLFARVLVRQLVQDPRFKSKSLRASPGPILEGVNPYTQTKPIHAKDNYSLEDFIRDLQGAKKVMVITGAGILTSLGIPDFRSFKGLYAQLGHLNLSDPQQAFDISAFKNDPLIFYSIASMILPPPDSNITLFHAFLKSIQDQEKLLRVYTQNIDDLELKAGIIDKKLVQCHGLFRNATCISCKTSFSGWKIHGHIKKKEVPRCMNCFEGVSAEEEVPINFGVIKPNITFFGEDLPRSFHTLIGSDIRSCDLALFVGTSLKVNPVASILQKIPEGVPRVLINKDNIDLDFDLKLQGNCDDIASYLFKRLNWQVTHKSFNDEVVMEYDKEDKLYKVANNL